MSNSRFLFSEHEKHISIKLEDCLSFFRIWSMEDLKEVTKKFQRSTQARWPIIAVIFLLWRWALENRKLTFETVVPKFWPLLSSVMKTKQIVIAEKAVSSEAFVQARHNVGLEPLEKMHCMSNSKMNSQYDAMSRYKGLRLLAVDGSKLNLPSRKELENAFGRPSLGPNTHTRYPQAFMVSLDLVRLGWIVDYRLGRYDSSELDFAGELTKNLGYGDLLMADRLYFRTRWIFNLHNKGVKYLLRLSSHRHLSFTKESQQKIETQGKNQTVIDCEVVLKIDTNKKGKPKHLLHCRYVEIRRIEQETLRFLTNLSYDFADSEEIAQLYLLRWGIETDFRLFKGQDHLPIVISRKENTVRQEILLRVLAHNSIRYVQAEACKIKNEETVTANPIIDGNSEKHAIYNKRVENNEKQVISETNENDTCPQQKKCTVIHIWMKRHISMNREILPVDLRMGISAALIIGNILYYSLYPGKRNPKVYIQLLNDILSQEILVKPGRHYPRRGRKYPKVKRKRRGDIKGQYERRKARKKMAKAKIQGET